MKKFYNADKPDNLTDAELKAELERIKKEQEAFNSATEKQAAKQRVQQHKLEAENIKLKKERERRTEKQMRAMSDTELEDATQHKEKWVAALAKEEVRRRRAELRRGKRAQVRPRFAAMAIAQLAHFAKHTEGATEQEIREAQYEILSRQKRLRNIYSVLTEARQDANVRAMEQPEPHRLNTDMKP